MTRKDIEAFEKYWPKLEKLLRKAERHGIALEKGREPPTNTKELYLWTCVADKERKEKMGHTTPKCRLYSVVCCDEGGRKIWLANKYKTMAGALRRAARKLKELVDESD